jgi:phosphate:Na+ symporter
MFQVLLNFLGAVIFVPMFYLEVYMQVPLVKGLVSVVAQDVEQQMANVVLVFNLFAAPLLALFLGPLHRCLVWFWPSTEEEDLSKVRFIHEQALGDPETAMDLVAKEHVRLIQRLPAYLEGVRTDPTSPQPLSYAAMHQPFTVLAHEVYAFLQALFEQNLALPTSERLLNLMNRHSLLVSIEETVYQFVTAIEQTTSTETVRRLQQNFVEGLDALLLTGIEAMTSSDESDIDLLIRLTADRGDLMERIRNTYLSSETALGRSDKSLLLHITNLFEQIVWLLRRLGTLLKSTQRFEAA